MITLLNKVGEKAMGLPKNKMMKIMGEFETGHYYSYGSKIKDYVLIPKFFLEK